MKSPIALVLAALALAGTAVSRADDPPPVALARLAEPAVKDYRGEAVGVASDFVIDMHERVVAFALVAAGPGAPPHACRIAPGGLALAREGLRLPGETRSLDAVPSCSASGWTRAEPGDSPRYVLASELRGSAVRDAQGNTVATLRDIVVEPGSARVRHALAEPARRVEPATAVMAIPLGPVRYVGGTLAMASATALEPTTN